MAAIRAGQLADNVISLTTKRPLAVSNELPSETKNSAEIYSLSSILDATLSPIVPTPKADDTRSRKARPHDDQYSLEEIAVLVPDLTDKELKSRFPKAWNEHQTIKKKCSRKTSRDTLHPGFATFRDFLTALGPAPSPRHSVDRIDPSNPIYGPAECRWTDKKTQARNRSTNVHLTWMGERKTLAEWADLAGIAYKTLQQRHRRRWPAEKIFADASVKHYRTVAPASAPIEISGATGCTAPNFDAAPAFDGDGWPVTLKSSRDFETGWTHARTQALKNGAASWSKNFFGAAVTGAQLFDIRRKLTDVGCWELIGSGRDDLHSDEIAHLEKIAGAAGIDIAAFYDLKPINAAFAEAYLADVEARAARSSYVHPRAARENAARALHELTKNPKLSNPLKVWEIFSRST